MSSRNDQCAVAGVKGISDAVRGEISTWVTEDLVALLFAAYQKTGGKMSMSSFRLRVQNAEAWKRYARPNDPNGPGFLRKYYCKEFGAKGIVDLHVITNLADNKITYVTFHVGGKMVYGGACNVPSTLFPQFSYKGKLTNTVTAGTTNVEMVAALVPFTEKQLQQLATQYEFGGTGAIDRMFEERV